MIESIVRFGMCYPSTLRIKAKGWNGLVKGLNAGEREAWVIVLSERNMNELAVKAGASLVILHGCR